MNRLVALLVVLGIAAAPLGVNAAPHSLLEAAEAAGRSGVFRAQNTPVVSTGLIRDDDKRRSALAFGISGMAAFVGAALWRWIPCRNQDQASNIAGLEIEGYNKCFDQDGNRHPWDTPTKSLVGAGIALNVVALGYFIAHLRSADQQDSDPNDP